MDLNGKQVWQHAAGDPGHNHTKLCLKWDLILSGPGDREHDVGVFRNEMGCGDIVVLKAGVSYVDGVGVVGKYDWCEEFNDVDGWGLGHTRRVRWLWKRRKSFYPQRPLTRATTQRVFNPVVLDWLEELEITNGMDEQSYCELPKAGEFVSRDEIAAYLFEMGIASNSIRDLLDPNGEFLQIANWYDGWQPRWSSPSEHETVSHLVVPLLQILGWTPQRMALEWDKIDVALFSRLPLSGPSQRDEAHLAVVLEAKRVRRPVLSWAVSQAKDYVKSESRSGCSRLVVTDGLRYGVFVRNNGSGEFTSSPYAYLNLTRPRNEYSIYGCKGAKEAILALTPEWQPDWR